MENPIEVHPFCGRGGLVHAAGCAALSLGRGRDAHHRPGSRPGQRRQQRRAVHVGANGAPHLLLIVSPRKCEGPGGIERTTMWIATSVASWRTPLPHNTVYNHKNESVGRDAGRSPGRSSVFRRGLRLGLRLAVASVLQCSCCGSRQRHSRNGIEPGPNSKTGRLAPFFQGSHQPAARALAREPEFLQENTF